MKEFTVAMSVADFIPVILFTASSVLMMRDLYNKMSKGALALLAAGLIDVICAGREKTRSMPRRRLSLPALSILFVIAFFGMLCMGYLSSRDFDKASMNWIAEAVNIIAQGSFLAGVVLTHKAGLAELKLEKEK